MRGFKKASTSPDKKKIDKKLSGLLSYWRGKVNSRLTLTLALKSIRNSKKIRLIWAGHQFHRFSLPDPMELVSCRSDNIFPFRLRKRHDFRVSRTWFNIFSDKSTLFRLNFSRQVRWCWSRCLKTFRSVSNTSRRASSGSRGRKDKRETDSWSARRDERTDVCYIPGRPPGAKPYFQLGVRFTTHRNLLEKWLTYQRVRIEETNKPI